MFRRLLPVFILMTLALAPTATAGPPGEDPLQGILPGDEGPVGDGGQVLDDTAGDVVPPTPEVDADTSFLGGLLAGAGDLVSDLGAALASGVSSFVGAIGTFFGAIWAGSAFLAVGAFNGVLWSVTGVAGLMGRALMGGVQGLGATVNAAIAGIDAMAAGLAGLRPEGMSETAWAGTVAASAAGATAAANYGLMEYLRRLGWLGAGVPLFSRIAKDDILDHPLRSEIFEAIKASPGIHISALSRTVDAGWGTTIHHLRKLQEKELVAVRTVNNQKCYFHNGGNITRSAWTQIPELKHDTANKIAQYILSRPLSPVTSVSTDLGLSPSLVSHHVRKLERAGVVEKIRDGRFVKLSVTAAARVSVFGEPTPGVLPQPVTGIAA